MSATATSTAPAGTSPRIGFVGAGPLATALAWSLARVGANVVGVAGRSRAPAERLAANIPGCRVHDAPAALLDDAELIFLAVPDDAIAPVARALPWGSRHAAIHCSGATELIVLSSAADTGASIGGFHPLQSFTDVAAAMRTLPGCTVAIEATEPLLGTLTALANALGCHPLLLPPGSRALYHAAATFASGYLAVLMNEGVALYEAAGLRREDAVRALAPLTRGTLAAIELNGPIKALSGAVARADIGTVERHIEALRQRAPSQLPIYLALARRAVPVAEAKGAADPARLAELKRLLETCGGTD